MLSRSVSDFSGILICLVNTYGLIYVFIYLGYGLIQLPLSYV